MLIKSFGASEDDKGTYHPSRRENLKAAVALHFAHYDFVRIHRTLRVTPAMAAGVADRLWTIGEMLNARA